MNKLLGLALCHLLDDLSDPRILRLELPQALDVVRLQSTETRPRHRFVL